MVHFILKVETFVSGVEAGGCSGFEGGNNVVSVLEVLSTSGTVNILMLNDSARSLLP